MVGLDDVVAMLTFARVVEHGSLAAASRALGVSKSVVSTRLSTLEDRLGVRLLFRTTRRLSLTDDGAKLYQRCSELLGAADQVAAELQGASRVPDGVLRVSVPVGFGLLQLGPMLREFTARWPRVRLELSLSDVGEEFGPDVDVAVRFVRRLGDASWAVRKLGVDELLLCGSPRYLDEQGTPEVPEDLEAHACLQLAGTDPEWTLERGSEAVTVRPNVNFVADNIVLLRDAVVDGMGVARMPRSVVACDLEAGRLRTVLDAYGSYELSIYVIVANRRNQPAKVRAFVEFLEECVRRAGLAGAPGH